MDIGWYSCVSGITRPHDHDTTKPILTTRSVSPRYTMQNGIQNHTSLKKDVLLGADSPRLNARSTRHMFTGNYKKRLFFRLNIQPEKTFGRPKACEIFTSCFWALST